MGAYPQPRLERRKLIENTAEAPAPFWGSVHLIEAHGGPDGKWTGVLYGYITIEPATITGMKPARGDTPWVAKIKSDAGDDVEAREIVWVPGCKVAYVRAGSLPENTNMGLVDIDKSGPNVHVLGRKE